MLKVNQRAKSALFIREFSKIRLWKIYVLIGSIIWDLFFFLMQFPKKLIFNNFLMKIKRFVQ